MAAANMLKGLGHSSFENYQLELNLPDPEAGRGSNLQDRVNSLLRFARNNPQRRIEGGDLLWDVIVSKATTLVPPDNILPPPNVSREEQDAFRRALDRDGFTILDGELRRTLPEDVDLPAADDEVNTLLERHGFTIPIGHLDQAITAHTNGDWAAANGQLRTFLQGLLDEMAELLEPGRAPSTKPGHYRRSLLADLSPPFLFRDLEEWTDDGKGFVNGLFKRLNPQGSHPGLSDEEDSTFRLHVVLIVTRLLLRRFDRRISTR